MFSLWTAVNLYTDALNSGDEVAIDSKLKAAASEGFDCSAKRRTSALYAVESQVSNRASQRILENKLEGLKVSMETCI
ncbi:hypothetical protein KAK06_18480 [Ideonella sp. 4Y11]|uniref:Uncharacterized protein n=1 Tax=Ideonella aquatica TaxID=2824119 RepID=A0A940YIM5_9BURK|nr:hypothetical protein [Ideonella aquatica]MBQ0960948.1 hypothetical protein [Ideonella aquatica]